MVVWTGYGFLSGLIPVAVFALTALVVGKDNQPVVGSLIASVVSAGLVWWIGRKLNTAPGRVLVDPKTSERLVLRRNHTMFWIPMEWWSIACLLVGVAVVVSLFTGPR